MKFKSKLNKANLRDLIAATGLVIKWDSNRQFFSPLYLEIWWMTLKNNRAALLYYVKLCASFQSHRWIQTWVTVRKGSIRVKISKFFVPCDLEIWRMTLKNNRAPLLCCFKLCASFHSHQWIQTGVKVRKCPIWVKIDDFIFCHVILIFDGWPEMAKLSFDFCDLKISWWYDDRNIVKEVQQAGRTYQRTQGDGQREVFLELLSCS